MKLKTAKRVYSRTVRDAHLAQTREMILQALSELLATKGLQELSVRKLAEFSGTSIRTIYRHFPNKASLLDAVSVWVQEKIQGSDFKYGNPRNQEDLLARLKFKFDQ